MRVTFKGEKREIEELSSDELLEAYNGTECYQAARAEVLRRMNAMEDRSSIAPKEQPSSLKIADFGEKLPEIVVVDGFFADPDAARTAALASDLAEHPERHQGLRSSDMPIPAEIREAFALMTGKLGHGHCAYQLNVAGEKLVYHSDMQRWAAAAYLTPNAPPDAGTSFWRSRATKTRRSSDLSLLVDEAAVPTITEAEGLVYGGALLDRTRWQEVDRVGNVFNRLALWRADLVHSCSDYFGHDRESGRLALLFFWDGA
jgi:hypothetical protein